MKTRYFFPLLAAALLSASFWTGALAQDKVVKKIIETGTTDNRTMQHADFLVNRIGGRIVGSAALTEAEAWVPIPPVPRASRVALCSWSPCPAASLRE